METSNATVSELSDQDLTPRAEKGQFVSQSELPQGSRMCLEPPCLSRIYLTKRNGMFSAVFVHPILQARRVFPGR